MVLKSVKLLGSGKLHAHEFANSKESQRNPLKPETTYLQKGGLAFNLARGADVHVHIPCIGQRQAWWPSGHLSCDDITASSCSVCLQLIARWHVSTSHSFHTLQMPYSKVRIGTMIKASLCIIHQSYSLTKY